MILVTNESLILATNYVTNISNKLRHFALRHFQFQMNTIAFTGVILLQPCNWPNIPKIIIFQLNHLIILISTGSMAFVLPCPLQCIESQNNVVYCTEEEIDQPHTTIPPARPSHLNPCSSSASRSRASMKRKESSAGSYTSSNRPRPAWA